MLLRLRNFLDPDRPAGTAPRTLFWTGLAIRLVFVLAAHTYHIRATNDHFEFGGEMGRIARALATGRGYSDPFDAQTGPTAWTPPLYPLILAGIFKIFGVYSKASALVIITLDCILSAATSVAVYQIARRTFRASADATQIALWSGWLWALHPAAMQYGVKWIWDMSLTAWLFSWVLVLALRLRDEPGRTRLWLLFGTMWGLIALSNSSLLTFFPFCALWMAWPALKVSRAALASSARNVVLAGVCCVGVMSPWIVRNAFVFHTFLPMRSNFGAELYESAWLLNEGYPSVATLHGQTGAQFRRYVELGELAYSREQGDRARAIIRRYPGVFVSHVFRRVYFFWVSVPHPTENGWKGIVVETGRELNYAFLSLAGLLGLALGLRNRVPAAWLFFWAFAVYPLIYYAVTVQARFRHPLEPIICVLAVYLFRSAQKTRKSGLLTTHKLTSF